jgi:uncharacterized protein involved in response to NO
MVFGFVAPVVAGFLLTAVQNWTGQPGLKGIRLACLVLLYLLPRILLLNQSWLPLGAVMIADLLFAPLTALFMAGSVLKVKQWRNLVFVPILLMLTITNAISYYGLFTADMALSNASLYAAVLVLTLVVALIGGRVIPFFTERATQWQRLPELPWLERASYTALLLLVLAVLSQHQAFIRIGAALAGILLFARWARWGWQHSFKVPLLWSLHLSYVFIPVGMLLIALDAPFSSGLHSVTVGGMGGMILAMMARVSLGHTGRQLVPPKPVVLGFGLMLLATVLRIGANLWTAQHMPLITGAALCWLIAFGCFCFYYGPMLCQPRADGRPG